MALGENTNAAGTYLVAECSSAIARLVFILLPFDAEFAWRSVVERFDSINEKKFFSQLSCTSY